MEVDQLTEAVADAARRACVAIRQAHAGERLAGFALCTDDCLSSLYAVGSTDEFLADHDPTWLFCPTEWTYDDGDDCFADAQRMLWARADATDETTFSQHVERSFASLVAVLKNLRSEQVVADDVFLVVCGTDPGELLTALEDAAVRELNPTELRSRWRKAVG